MGKSAVAAAILVAACGNEKALAIQVSTTDSSITTIELFVGDTSCDSCVGVAPPSSVAKPKGPVVYTGEGQRFEAAVGREGVAGFRLEPSPTTATVAKLAAIGFTADGTPRGFVLDDAGFAVGPLEGTVRRYTLTDRPILQAQGLTPAVAPENGSDDPTDQIIVWRAPNADAATPSCLAIEHRDGTNEFLVPPGDPDCDGISANECDPDWYMYSANTTTPCLTQPAPASACVVGSKAGCSDGAASKCEAEHSYCFPARACAEQTCGLFDGPGCLDHLIPDPSDANSPVAALRCSVAWRSGTDAPCPGTTLVTLPSSSGCTATFLDLAPGFPANGPPGTQDLPFNTATFNGSLHVDPTSTVSACRLAVSSSFKVEVAPPHAAVGRGVLAVANPGSGFTLILPVIVDFLQVPVAVCPLPASAVTCAYENTMADTIYRCTH
ncbi:hypothetical protein BH11MYX1_BH11MYX1_08820 [soil metagenome]